MEKIYEFKREIKYVPEISTKTVDKKRYYVTPNKVLYPSITTVLSQRGKEGLFEWRKRVGEDVANYIARTSANRGSAVHKMCEDYLNNQHIYNPTDFAKHSRKHFLGYCLFNRLKDQVLKNIDNIYAQETALWSDRLMVAGRVDCIARYKGVPTIIDFKTSRSERTDEWNENYYIQATAYSEMFEERIGMKIDQIAILVVTEDGTVQEFLKNKKDYLHLLDDALKVDSHQDNAQGLIAN
jgi:hypothetical protein